MLGESGFVIEDKFLVVSGKDMILFETLDEADVEHNSSGVGDTKLKSCTALSCTTSPGSRKGLTGAFHANDEFLENSSPHESFYLFPNNYQSYIKKPRRESKDVGKEQTIR